MKVKVLIKSISTSAGIKRQDDIIDIPNVEVKKILSMKPTALEIIEVAVMPSMKNPSKKKRARNSDGTLKADDKSTPNVNEAYE
tara:strand:- start:445 stop:696 length:252 start_codon:yes stop_codon:yes gene_type:complete